MMTGDAREMIEAEAAKCLDCGACTASCDILPAIDPARPGSLARQVLAGELGMREEWFIPRCALCRRCETACPAQVRIADMVTAMRSLLIAEGRIDVERYRAMWVDYDWNAISLFRDTYALGVPSERVASSPLAFMPGCSLFNEGYELLPALMRLLDGVCGAKVALLPDCCGMPLAEMGLRTRYERFADGLWERIADAGYEEVLVACPNCLAQLESRGEALGVRVTSVYERLACAGVKAPARPGVTVSVHDSCPARGTQLGAWVREILSGYDLREMECCGDKSRCCGSGGAVSLFDFTMREVRAQRRAEEFARTGADWCVCACMSSCSTLDVPPASGRVRHVLELVLDQEIDRAECRRKMDLMWQGDQGARNEHRLAHSRPLAKER
ncbi:(Fe-S)-binding protein [Adlercreutzia sp. ZJ176]|uniref:(Fe-S)-binding protein n=2 Tax=unclassified Adlercreutzia TaxID=2636013 RepID=UPI0013ECFCD1|nr:(Fe-S)-binding protein [Adlercreutzia sp. ZJ176]